jgi:cytochrome P450
VPLYNPIKGIDGRRIREIVIPKDTSILVSIINFNRDPALWGPDSYEWKPERWLSPVSSEVTEAPTPGVYSYLSVSNYRPFSGQLINYRLGRMTFFGGGRACM